MDIRYWRTSTGMEADFVPGEMDVALEIKGARRTHEGDIRGLTALLAEHKVIHPLLIHWNESRAGWAREFGLFPGRTSCAHYGLASSECK